MSGINPYALFLQNSAWTGQNTITQTATILSTALDVDQLATSVILKGTVESSTNDGHTTIKTKHGTITALFDRPPKKGSTINIQIQKQDNQTVLISQTKASNIPSLAQNIQNISGNPPPQNQPSTTVINPAQDGVTFTPPTTNTTVNNANKAEIETLQQTIQSARISATAYGSSTLTTLPTGQAIRLLALPNHLQTMQAIQTQFPLSGITPTLSQGVLPQMPAQAMAPTIPVHIPPSAGTTPAMIMQPPLPAQTNATIPLNTTIVANMPASQPQAQIISTHAVPSMPLRQLSLPPVTTPPPPHPTMMAGQPITTMGQPLPAAQPPFGDYSLQTPITMTAPSITAPQGAHGATTPMTMHMAQNTLILQNHLARAGDIIGTFTGYNTKDGHPIISIPQSTTPTNGANVMPSPTTPRFMAIQFPDSTIPAGATIRLTPLPSASIGPSNNGLGTTPPQTPALSNLNITQDTIPLTTIMSALGGAQQGVSPALSLLPSLGNPKTFPAAALLFLAAAKNGDLSGWLGTHKSSSTNRDGAQATTPSTSTTPATATQTQTPRSIIETLFKEMAHLQSRPATTNDPVPQQSLTDWRGYTVPTLNGDTVTPMTIWSNYNKERQNKSAHPDEKDIKNIGTRFIIALNLSRMGDIQFDGYAVPDKKTLDVSLMTRRDIHRDTQNQIKTIWYNALESLDLSGHLSFKTLS